jgi:cell wall assembly regulator SMI1
MDKSEARRKLAELLAGLSGPPPSMAELVSRLDAWLSRHRPEYYARLLPGLTDAEWADFEAALSLKLPDGFRVLYQWRNGQPEDYFKSFRGNQTWMSVAEIRDTKQVLDEMIGYDFEPGWWDANWVPFLHNGGGSYLCVEVADKDGGRPGQLVESWKADPDRPVVSPSVEHWLHDFVNSLDRDHWEETRVGFECVESTDPTGDRLHPETDTGPPVGREEW